MSSRSTKTTILVRLYPVMGLLVVVCCCLLPINVHAAAGINKQVNFQGRLLNAQGATVPDGNYNVQFKIYQDGDGQSVGNTTGSPGGSLKWTEDHLNTNSQGVTIRNGYLSVQLGAVTPFGASVDWNQDTLWLSLNIGNTNATCTPFSSCVPDGEMVPMKRLSSTPYALNSGLLGGLASSQFVQLAQGVQADASNSTNSIFINKTGTGGNFIDLQASGTDAFVLSNTGNVAFGNNVNHTVSVTTASAGATGKSLTISAGAAGTGGSALVGGDLVLQAGTGGGTNGNGGNLTIDAGAANGSGSGGTVNVGTANANIVNIATNTAIHTISIGNGAAVQGIIIGSTNSTSSLVIQAGTGNLSIQTQGGTLGIANNTVAQTVQIGNATGASSVTLQSGSGGITFTGATSVSGNNTFATGTGIVTIQGTTSISANATFTNGSNVAFQRGTDYGTTGSANNVSFGSGVLIRLTGVATQTITGISGGVDGRVMTIVNAASQAATISNLSGSSTATNQISTGTGADLSLAAGASASLVYDSGASLWRVVGATTVAGGYIQLQTATPGTQQTGNFNISGTGIAGAFDSVSAGTLNIGTANASTVQIGNINLSSGTQTIAIGNNNTSGGTTNVTVGANISATGGLTTLQAKSNIVLATNGVTRGTFDTANNFYLGNGSTATSPNNFTVQGTGSSTSAVTGGSLTIQGGIATVGNANGGALVLAGGSGIGSGVSGLVNISATAFSSATQSTCAANCTLTQSNIDSYSTVIVNASVAGITMTLPNPTTTATTGRLIYITAANGSTDFTLHANSGASSIDIAMRQNATATMVWNGSAWTAAGASNATTLQATYNNGSNPSTTPEIKLDSTHGTIDIQDADVSIGSDLFNIHASNVGNLGTVLFGVGSTGTVTIRNNSDQQAAFRFLNTAGNYVLNVNTANNYFINNGTRSMNNEIVNPGFEAGVEAGGNTTFGEQGWFGSAQSVSVNSSADAHTGNYELQVTPNGTNLDVYANGYFEVQPGDTIYFEGWVKNSVSANGTGGTELTFYDKDKANPAFSTNYSSLPGTAYILKTITATVPAGKYFVRASATVRSTATSGTYYFDDFLLRRSNVKEPQLLQNSVDSTSAFQIQNAGATNTLFTADTTNNILKVGDSTGTDTNTTIFVLDAATANPTTLTSRNGGLFYRSDTNNVKAIIGGAVYDVCTTAAVCSGYGASAGSIVNLQASSPGTQQTGNFNISGTGILSQLQTQDASSGSTNTSDLVIRSGNASGATSNSGSLTLDTGTATGTAGSITIGHSGVTTTMPGNLIIQGSNALSLGTSASTTGSLKLYNSVGSNTLTVAAAGANPTSSWTLTLPQNPGNSGDCIKASDAAGTLGFGNCTSGATTTLQDAYNNSSSPALVTLANSKDLKFIAQDTATDPNVLIDLQCTTCSANGGRFAIQNSGTDVFTVNPNGGGIVLGAKTQIGSSTTNSTQTNLQLDSSSTLTDSGTCNTTTNQGALYYNTSSLSIRTCQDSSWVDVLTTKDLGLLMFGVVPDSGSNPWDLPSKVTSGVSGPCKPSWASATTVNINACIAYSGGRRLSVPTTTVTITGMNTGTTRFAHICLNSSGTPTLQAIGTSLTANMPTFSITAPILCLADVVGSATTANNISSLYDTRTFTTTVKTAVVASTAVENGMIIDVTTNGAAQPAVAASQKLNGVVVVTDGSTSATTPNAIIAVAGPSNVKCNTTCTAGDFIKTSATNGYGTTTASIPNNSFYFSVGNARNAFITTCTASSNCNGSVYVDFIVR